MNKFVQVGLLCYISFVMLCIVDIGSAKDSQHLHHRPRRFLSFRNTTHFFLRLNIKDNIIWWNQIFAQAVGFRMNWNEPPDTFHPYHRLYRRSVYSNLEVLLDKNGLNGYHCLRRAICEIGMIDQPTSLYYRILKMVFRRQSSETSKWHDVAKEECTISILSCPFSLLDVSLYTDT